jgi:uncharacterized protein involved in outer membrane biogenesis
MDCMAARRFVKPLLFVVIPVAAIVTLIAFCNWDWLIPIVEDRASSALGRRVTTEHLHLQLGWDTTVSADDVRIANPADFPEQGHFARIAQLSVQADVMAYIRSREIVLPEILLERPEVQARQTADGKNNYTLPSDSGPAGPAAKIGDLRISDGQARVVIPSLKADFALRIATREAPLATRGTATPDSQIVVEAKGIYAGQPVTGQLVGGALLSLRDAQRPYPVDFKLVNGPTHVRLTGTLTDPLTFGGADLKLELAGADGLSPSASCQADCVGHFRAAAAERLRLAGGGFARSLMLDFRIEFAADQNDDDRQPHPHHKADNGAQRAIGFVEGAKICCIPGEEGRGGKPGDRRKRTAPGDPLPARFGTAWAIPINESDPEGDEDQQDRPPGDV